MKPKAIGIASVAILVVLVLVYIRLPKPATTGPVPGGTNGAGSDATAPWSDGNGGSADLDESVDAGTAIEDVGLAISVSGYRMDGPMDMRIRKDVDHIDLNAEGQGFTVRTSGEDTGYMAAVESVEKRLSMLKFAQKEFPVRNTSSPVLEYRQYTRGGVVCVYEKRKIGNTGNVDIIIGCFDRSN